MPNYKTEQLSILLEVLIDQYGHNTPRLLQELREHLDEYFSGDSTELEENRIVLSRIGDDFELYEAGIIEIYEEELRGHFPSSRIDKLKNYKDENSLDFAFLLAFNNNNHIKIREVDDNVNFLDLDYNT